MPSMQHFVQSRFHKFSIYFLRLIQVFVQKYPAWLKRTEWHCIQMVTIYIVGSPQLPWPRYLYEFNINTPANFTLITSFETNTYEAYTSGITFAYNDTDPNGLHAPILFGINGHDYADIATVFTISLKDGTVSNFTQFASPWGSGRTIVYSPADGYLYSSTTTVNDTSTQLQLVRIDPITASIRITRTDRRATNGFPTQVTVMAIFNNNYLIYCSRQNVYLLNTHTSKMESKLGNFQESDIYGESYARDNDTVKKEH